MTLCHELYQKQQKYYIIQPQTPQSALFYFPSDSHNKIPARAPKLSFCKPDIMHFLFTQPTGLIHEAGLSSFHAMFLNKLSAPL